MAQARTQDILAELEELGATGEDKPIPIRKVESVSIEEGSPSPRMLDERGEKMIELSDLVIEEFDQLIQAAQRIRGAVAEMRDMWRGSSEDVEDVEDVEDEEDEIVEVGEDEEDEEDVLEDPEENYPNGVPSPSGAITLSIPESQPLPPEVARLTDADLSIPPTPMDEGTNE